MSDTETTNDNVVQEQPSASTPPASQTTTTESLETANNSTMVQSIDLTTGVVSLTNVSGVVDAPPSVVVSATGTASGSVVQALAALASSVNPSGASIVTHSGAPTPVSSGVAPSSSTPSVAGLKHHSNKLFMLINNIGNVAEADGKAIKAEIEKLYVHIIGLF
jgi:hypothetical protein